MASSSDNTCLGVLLLYLTQLMTFTYLRDGTMRICFESHVCIYCKQNICKITGSNSPLFRLSLAAKSLLHFDCILLPHRQMNSDTHRNKTTVVMWNPSPLRRLVYSTYCRLSSDRLYLLPLSLEFRTFPCIRSNLFL